jgi:hypothetical protein
MDKELVDNLIKVVLDDKEKTNNYDHLDKLILSLSDEELDYFLNECGEDLFLNYSLSFVLAVTIPKKMKRYAQIFVHDKLQIIDLMEKSVKNEYIHGRMSQELYEETIKEYDEVRKEADRFLTTYMIEIDKEINKKIK